MKKEQLARKLAKESHISTAAAADQLDRIMSDLFQKMRKGQSASLPGLGTFRSGREEDFQVRSRRVRRCSARPRKAPDEARTRASPVPADQSIALTRQRRAHPAARAGARQRGGHRRAGHVPAGPQPGVPLRRANQAARLHRLCRGGSLRGEEAVSRPSSNAGFRPWLDKKKLMPGQNWPRAIENGDPYFGFLRGLFFAALHHQARQPSTASCATRWRARPEFLWTRSSSSRFAWKIAFCRAGSRRRFNTWICFRIGRRD